MCDSFVFYKSFMDALEYVPREEYCDCVSSLLNYAFYGESEPESPTAKMFMTLVIPQIDANTKRRENGKKGAEYGKKGGRPKNEPLCPSEENPIGVNDETPNVNVNVNANENGEKENSPSESKRKRFTPPTVDEVREYCLERQNGIDPEAFVAFYESKGWKVGKSPMKDWKAAMVTWEKKRKDDSPRQQPSNIRQFNKFDQGMMHRGDDNADLVKQIMAMSGG